MADVYTYSDLQPPEGLGVGESAALRPGVTVTLLHPSCTVASRGSAVRHEALARIEDGFPNPTSPPIYAVTVETGLLAGQRSVLAGGHVYSDVSFQYPAMRTDRKQTYQAIFPYEFKGQKHLRQRGDTLALAPGGAHARLPDRAFIATSTESINFGSWIFRILPKFVIRAAEPFQRAMSGYGSDVVAPADRPWKTDMASRGAPHARLFAHDINAVYAFRDAVFLSQPVRNGMFPEWLLSAVQAMVPERLEGGGPRRIYVSRRRWSQVRKTRTLINEAEVETALETRGFAIHRPEDHTLADNARVFGGADIVVGPSGAGMFNAVFCRPGTVILEIEQSAGWRSTHANLYRSAGLRFGFVDNRQGMLHSHGYGHDSYWTDVDRLVRAVDEFIG